MTLLIDHFNNELVFQFVNTFSFIIPEISEWKHDHFNDEWETFKIGKSFFIYYITPEISWMNDDDDFL